MASSFLMRWLCASILMMKVALCLLEAMFRRISLLGFSDQSGPTDDECLDQSPSTLRPTRPFVSARYGLKWSVQILPKWTRMYRSLPHHEFQLWPAWLQVFA